MTFFLFFLVRTGEILVISCEWKNCVGSLVPGRRTGKVFWEELKLELKINFSKNRGLTRRFQVGGSVHIFDKENPTFCTLGPVGKRGRWATVALWLCKSCIPLSGHVTNIFPAQYLRSHFETDICSAIWEPQTEDGDIHFPLLIVQRPGGTDFVAVFHPGLDYSWSGKNNPGWHWGTIQMALAYQVSPKSQLGEYFGTWNGCKPRGCNWRSATDEVTMWWSGRVLIQESGHLGFSPQLTHWMTLRKSISFSEPLCSLFVQLGVRLCDLGVFLQLWHSMVWR